MNLKKYKSRLMLIILVLNIFCITNIFLVQNSSALGTFTLNINKSSMNVGDTVTLTWSVPEMGDEKYEESLVYRSINGGGYQYITIVSGVGSRSYNYEALEAGLYRFKVLTRYYHYIPIGGSGGYIQYGNVYVDIAYGERGYLQVYNKLVVYPLDNKLWYGGSITLYWTNENHPTGYNEYSEVFCSYKGGPFQKNATLTGIGLKSYTMKAQNTVVAPKGDYRFKIINYANFGSNSGGVNDEKIWESATSDVIKVGDVEVDVKIAYDSNVKNYLTRIGKSPSSLADSVYYALNHGYGQYFPIKFYTKTTDDWLVYDEDGHNVESPPSLAQYRDWENEAPINWNSGQCLLPPGEGHGYYFDILVLFIWDFGTVHVATQGGISSIIINLEKTEYERWDYSLLGRPFRIGDINLDPFKFIGTYSVIMHELAHIYGVTGDTRFQKFSVMDYEWTHYGFGDKFDADDQEVIWKTIHSLDKDGVSGKDY